MSGGGVIGAWRLANTLDAQNSTYLSNVPQVSLPRNEENGAVFSARKYILTTSLLHMASPQQTGLKWFSKGGSSYTVTPYEH
jgi:hypothetical protein